MHTRWFRYLLAVMFVLMLLPVMALARDHDRDWDRHHDRHNRNYSSGRYYNGSRYYNNGYYGNGYYNNQYYGNSGYWGNGSNRKYRCVDPDHDGDCDYYVRRHHHGNYQNGWYTNGYYPNTNGWSGYSPNASGWYGYYPNGNVGNLPFVSPYTWGNGYATGYAFNQAMRGVYNATGVYNAPRGWQQGRKKGWGKSNLSPGLAKKSGWW